MEPKSSEIYSQGYEKWLGERNRALPAWYLIGTSAVRNLVGSSGCLARSLFIIFFVVYYFLVIASTVIRLQWKTIAQWDFLRDLVSGLDPNRLGLEEVFYHKTWVLYPSLIFCSMVMIFYGSQLIAKDRSANALQVYFSKAVSRIDYVVGKYLAVGILTSLTTLVPSAMMLVLGLILSPERVGFLSQSWFIPLVTISFWLVLSLVLGSVILFFSASFDKSYLAAVSFIGFLFFALILTGFLILIFGHSHFVEGLNWGGGLVHVGNILFDRKVSSWNETLWKSFDLLLIVLVFGALIFKKIKPVEVVK